MTAHLKRRGFLPLGNLAACLLLAGGFASLGALVLDTGTTGTLAGLDLSVGLALQQSRLESPMTRSLFLGITRLGAADVLVGVAGTAALVLALTGRPRTALVWALALLPSWLLVLTLKETYGRPRPPFRDPGAVVTTDSFPSGHALGSLVVYGGIAFLAARLGRRRWVRLAGPVVLAGLVLAITFSRLYLGVHYLTDVAGGLAAGGAWLILGTAAVGRTLPPRPGRRLPRQAAESLPAGTAEPLPHA